MYSRRLILPRLALLIAFSTIGLQGAALAADADKPAEAAAKKAPEALSPTAIVARVNGVDITGAEVERAKKALLAQNRMQQPINAEMGKMIEDAAVNQLIAKELLYQAGRKLENKDLDKQVEAKIAQGKARFSSPAEYEKAIKALNMTEKDVEQFAREDAIINNLIEKELASKVTVTDADAKKFYNGNQDKFKQEASVKASHILIGADAKATPEEKAKAKEKAEAILKKIRKGADFAETAKSESSCPSSAMGGDLGYFSKGQMVPEFEKTAFAMKPGDVSDVVETQFGYHIIKVTDKKEAETVKFDDVKEKITQYIKGQKVQQSVGAYIEDLKKKAKIEISPK